MIGQGVVSDELLEVEAIDREVDLDGLRRNNLPGSKVATSTSRAHTEHPKRGADPTFEADPIGRRLECLPKKGININFYIIFGIFNGAPGGPRGELKYAQGPRG